MMAPRVEDHPNVLPADGVRGRFSDLGSWLEVSCGDGALLDVRDGSTGAIARVHVDSAIVVRTVWCDRLEATLANGARVEVAFADPDTLLLAMSSPVAVRVEGLASRRCEGGWLVGRRCQVLPTDDVLATRRQTWNALLARAHAACGGPTSARDCTLLVRAVTTLQWNARRPIGDQQGHGVVPSPFAYPGYWGWDSWKHAHALAPFAPSLARDQVRVQFGRARGDGMVPDTVMPDASQDNWHNTKPALACWALERLTTTFGDATPVGRALASGDVTEIAEMLPRALAFLGWWDAQRRLPGAVLHSCGGIDRQTAMWDSGWDDAVRFDGVPLRSVGAWQLFDLWCADTNAYHLVEMQAAVRLAARCGVDATPWAVRAQAQQKALATLWDPAIGAFADVRSDGTSTGTLSLAAVVPVWAGIATPGQLASTRAWLRDPRRFATPMPFPTLAASDPRFDPDGYWNGGVWLDHAAMALVVLGDEGDELRERLLDHVHALPALYECYSPRTGQPVAGNRPAVPQFSWSAAAVLEMLGGGPHPR